MSITTPASLANVPLGSGIRPFGYVVEFADEPMLSDFGPTTYYNTVSGVSTTTQGTPPNLTYNWSRREVSLESVEVGHGSDPYKAVFHMWDPDSVDAPNIIGIDRTTRMAKPVNGQVVLITLLDPNTPQAGQVLFKGSIRSIHEEETESGIMWVVTADSEVTRLNDTQITFKSNQLADPVHPNPVFASNGEVVIARMRTLKELFDDIISFQNAWGFPEYFSGSDIVWNGLDTSRRCGLFVPHDIDYSDMSKGRAIEDLLQRAGNYSFVYVPVRSGRDQLVIVEHNLQCNRCGPQWSITFPDTDKNVVDYETPYAYDYQIKQDSTEWSSEQSCNVVRLTSGYIRFYSGHYIIPETNDDEAVTFYADGTPYNTIPEQQNRAINQDNCVYRFTTPNASRGGLVADDRTRHQYFVGMALFPDWDPHADYQPLLQQIGSVDLVTGTAWPSIHGVQSTTGIEWRGAVEFSPSILGDRVFQGEHRNNTHNNMRVYQAWHYDPDKTCPACGGSGNVKAVYSGAVNEPAYLLVAASTSGVRTCDLSNFAAVSAFTPQSDELVHLQCTNYIFNPNNFGNYDPITKVRYLPTGLTPFDPTDQSDPVVQATGGYPLPWKNLCPYCRGVGFQPLYKLRNIQPDLFKGRNNQQPDQLTGNYSIPIDPDATASGPETWDQTQSRLTVHEGPQIQVESYIHEKLPVYVDRNRSFNVIQQNATAGQATNKNFNEYPGVPHPLIFQNLSKLLPLQCTDSTGVSDPVTAIVQSNWTVDRYHTTVNMWSDAQVDAAMGKVIFKSAIGIPCNRLTFMFKRNTSNLHYWIGEYGTLQPDASPRMYSDKQSMPLAYFRPARVWMTFYYTRDNWYHNLVNDSSGNPIDPVDVSYTNDDGETADYLVRCIVLDGRFAMEITKKNADMLQDGTPVEFATGNRLITYSASDYNLNIDMFYKDLDTYLVPSSPDLSQEGIYYEKLGFDAQTIATYETAYSQWQTSCSTLLPEENKPAAPQFPGTEDEIEIGIANTRKSIFPYGKVLMYGQSSPGEQQAEMDGYTNLSFALNFERYKTYKWKMRDQRPRMLQLGIKKLEIANDIKVSGDITLVGKWFDISTGLGYVVYPEQGNATVMRITYNFSGGFETNIVLSREHARLGELPPKADELQDDVGRQIAKLERSVFVVDSSLQSAWKWWQPKVAEIDNMAWRALGDLTFGGLASLFL
jgi:hypothetical protein